MDAFEILLLIIFCIVGITLFAIFVFPGLDLLTMFFSFIGKSHKEKTERKDEARKNNIKNELSYIHAKMLALKKYEYQMQESILIKKQKIVEKTSRVVLKIQELNACFLKFDVPVAEVRKTAAFCPILQQTTVRQYYNSEIKLAMLKIVQYNRLVKKYNEFYDETTANIHTPLEIIKKSNLDQQEYLDIEKALTNKLKLQRDNRRNEITLTLTHAGHADQKYQFYEWNFRFKEDDFAVGFDYIPKDIEWEKTLEQREFKCSAKEENINKIKLLPRFLRTLQNVSAKKVTLGKIDSHIFKLGNIYYFPFENYALVGGCDEGIKGITISDVITINGKNIKVTGILENAFKNNHSIKEVIVPSSIELIGDSAFSGCYQLKEIYIPDSVAFVGDNVFDSCLSLVKVSLNKSAQLGRDVFNMCNKCTVEKR